METSQFNRLAQQVFGRVVDAFDALDPDRAEADPSAGFIEITFADGACFVVSTQSAAHQIWLAADARGWHFDYDPGRERWISTRGDDELLSTLEELVGARLGEPFSI